MALTEKKHQELIRSLEVYYLDLKRETKQQESEIKRQEGELNRAILKLEDTKKARIACNDILQRMKWVDGPLDPEKKA